MNYSHTPERHQMAKLAVLLLLALLCHAQISGPPQNTQGQLQELGERAQQLQSNGDYRGAIQNYKKMLDLRPELTEVRVNLGLLEHLSGDYAAALADFQRVLKSTPGSYVPNLMAGFDLLKIGQPQTAIRYLLQAQRLKPKDPQPDLGLGQGYAALRQFDKANAAYYRASVNASKKSEAYYGLGITYLSLSKDAAERIKQIDANAPLARSLLGEALLEQGKLVQATSIFQSLVKSETLPNPVCWFLGLTYERQNKLAEAATELQRVLHKNPGCLGAYLGLASLRLREKDADGALDELDHISQVDPAFLQANLSLLWQQFQLEQLNGVLADMEEKPPASSSPVRSTTESSLKSWLSGDIGSYVGKQDSLPSNISTPSPAREASNATQLLAQGRFSQCFAVLRGNNQLGTAQELKRAECAFAIGDYRTAFVASASLLSKDQRSLPALYWRTRSASRLATESLVQAVRADPESPRAHLLLAETFREKQDYPKAQAEYTKALDLDRGFIPAELGLATLFWDLSQFDKALPVLQTVLKSTPQDSDANYMLAYILVQNHEFDAALPPLRYALTGRPEVVAKSHALLSKIYAAQGRIPAALTEIRLSLQADSDGSYHYQMAQLYQKLGDEAAAARALQESEALRRDNNQ